MKKTFFLLKFAQIISISLVVGLCVFVWSSGSVLASITNPAIGELGGNDDSGTYSVDPANVRAAQTGASLLGQFVRLWGNVVTIGVIMVLIMFIWGAIEWITAGGDAAKITKARDRILQSAIGLLVLVSLFIIIGFLSGTLFGGVLDILNPKFVTPNTSSNPRIFP